MMPYILNILHNSGTPQDVPAICEKLRQFNFSTQVPDEDIQSFTEQALERALAMGLVKQNGTNNSYTLANKWFMPESQSFQLELHEAVQNMPQALAEAYEPLLPDVATSSNYQSANCMGPGMVQRRSPAQIRAISIYHRMREQREREEREAAARSRKRRNSGSRSRSKSRTRTRRASSASRTRSQSKRRSRPRSRSKVRSRSTSRSKRR